jgi:hypothetical protein
MRALDIQVVYIGVAALACMGDLDPFLDKRPRIVRTVAVGTYSGAQISLLNEVLMYASMRIFGNLLMAVGARLIALNRVFPCCGVYDGWMGEACDIRMALDA